MDSSLEGEGKLQEPELVGYQRVMGNGMRCRGSRTWHVEDGSALVHGKHVGARANVDACILGLDVLNCQDAVEVHGPVGQLPVTPSGPDQGVGRRLRRREQINTHESQHACDPKRVRNNAPVVVVVGRRTNIQSRNVLQYLLTASWQHAPTLPTCALYYT